MTRLPNPRPFIGMRVQLKEQVERYPHFIALTGLKGTVTVVEDKLLAVKMDELVPNCAYWDNELHWYDFDGNFGNDMSNFWIYVEPIIPTRVLGQSIKQKDRFEFRGRNLNGSMMYGCPHELHNEVLVTFPPGYWDTGPGAGAIPSYVDFRPFQFEVSTEEVSP